MDFKVPTQKSCGSVIHFGKEVQRSSVLCLGGAGMTPPLQSLSVSLGETVSPVLAKKLLAGKIPLQNPAHATFQLPIYHPVPGTAQPEVKNTTINEFFFPAPSRTCG